MPVKQGLPKDFRKFPHGFPTRENCDPANPYEAYLWALVAFPYQQGAQLVMPVDYLQFVSKRLWDCFGPPNPEWQPLIRYQKPLNTDPNALTSPGSWVPADAPVRDERRPVEVAVDSLINQQRSELADELVSRMSPERLKASLTDEQREAFRLKGGDV